MRLYEAMAIQQSVQELDKEAWERLRSKAQKKVLNEAPKEVLGKYRDPEAKTSSDDIFNW